MHYSLFQLLISCVSLKMKNKTTQAYMLTKRIHSLLLVIQILSISTVRMQSATSTLSREIFTKQGLFFKAFANILHIERDWYKNDGSIIYSTQHRVATTNGNRITSTLVQSAHSYFSGFKQINRTHLVFSEAKSHCVKLINRKNKIMETLAGICGSPGITDGAIGVGKLLFPYTIDIDIKNRGRLLILDIQQNALRFLLFYTKELGTVIQSGFNQPISMEWTDSGTLLVANRHYISEVRWENDSSVTNEMIVGSNSSGDKYGFFSNSRFTFPCHIERAGINQYYVTDFNNKVLKYVQLSSEKVGYVCFDYEGICRSESSKLQGLPKVVLKEGDDVYITFDRNIYKYKTNHYYLKEKVQLLPAPSAKTPSKLQPKRKRVRLLSKTALLVVGCLAGSMLSLPIIATWYYGYWKRRDDTSSIPTSEAYKLYYEDVKPGDYEQLII